MVTIHSSTHTLKTIQQIIEANGDLSNYVELFPLDKKREVLELDLFVIDNEIVWPVEWLNRHIPIYVPVVPFSEDNLLCLILLKMGHYPMAESYAINEVLNNHVTLLKSLSEGLPMLDMQYNSLHAYNKALYNQYNPYGNYQLVESTLIDAEEEFIKADWKIMARKHLAVLKADKGNDLEAIKINLDTLSKWSLSDESKASIALDLTGFLANYSLTCQEDDLIRDTKDCVDFGISFFKEHKFELEEAMMQIDLGQIKGARFNFQASLSLFDSGIYQLNSLEQPDLMYSAIYRKAKVLHHWSQNGNPQFYKLALEAYNKSLKFYTQSDFPEVFFEIHSQLAMIYAEIPSDGNQNAIWAAFSATSFKEALDFYAQSGDLDKYATVANNYANALINFPEAKNSDNIEKAIHYFNEALEIRTAKTYPQQRAFLILNYLEACWLANNINNHMERVRLEDMMSKVKEVKSLTDNKEAIQRSEEHLAHLIELKKMLLTA